MAAGLLFVLSEQGSVPAAEFHDWYDGEHAPARMALAGVHTGRRFRATDGTTPTWLAAYDIDLDVLATPAYRALRDRRSPREQAVIDRLAVLDRRVYELIDEHGSIEGSPPVVVCTSMSVPADREPALHSWYLEEHIPLLHAIPGWLRTRRYRLADGDAPTFLAFHELADITPLETAAYRHATSTPRRDELMRSVTARERRVFAFHRAFEPAHRS
ncbi:hypothetical protein HC031_25705 [Planosporangium thailandense]|uniref:EthD domain-containing protein n=1 Tax=Planosporangium thailandense TaxID=765197 RepID=A0ABX0Y3X2_9ACTN|nr:hypothetical protein [Planosporangium thailandense]NJC73086.1 hypothetical protein [Planosporangium thailandense]